MDFLLFATDIEEQAKRWAKRKALISGRKNADAKSILNIYEYNKEAAEKGLNIKIFDAPSLEWMDFVIACRSDVDFKHDYEIVSSVILRMIMWAK